MVVGIDAATLDLIGPWAQKGRLPTLKKLMDEGVSGELRSTVPPLTAPAWTSLVTGKNPGKHGIFDFTKRGKGSYEMTIQSSLDRDEEAVWEIVAKENKKVVVMNVPLTYPPERVNGIMISGIPAPESRKDFVYPRELLREIETEVGGYMLLAGFEYRFYTCGLFFETGWKFIKKPRMARPLMEPNHFRSFPVIAGFVVYFGG